MVMNLQTPSLKIRQYREQVQESLADVSEATGISRDRLSEIEEGRSSPTGDEVLILADHWKYDFRFFISDRPHLTPFAQTEILYRAHDTEFLKQDRQAIQEFLYLCETEAFLMQELKYTVKTFSFTPSGDYYKAQGEKGALAFRQFLGYEEPGKPPMLARDVYEDIRSVGVHVFRRKLMNANISGLFILHPVAGPCILVNYNEDVYRQRFTVAHEMAHAIFDTSSQVIVSLVNCKHPFVEVRANRFAACYLMPLTMLQKLKSLEWHPANVLKWANSFRVSCDALGIALKEAQLVDDSTSRTIRSYKIPAAEKTDPELPETLSPVQRERKKQMLAHGLSGFYVDLCFEAFHQTLISKGRLAEALLVDKMELSEVAVLYGRKL